MRKIAVDISKDKFDAAQVGQTKCFSNQIEGFTRFIEWVKPQDNSVHFIMEASGPYYLKLATFLFSKGFCVSVINPLVIRRFAQMKLLRTKTDKVDATVILEYGNLMELPLWQPASHEISELQQLSTAREQLVSQATATRNSLGAINQTPHLCQQAIKALSKVLLVQKEEIEKIDRQMQKIARECFELEYELLQSIPGIGPKMAVMLLMVLRGANQFEKAKQLVAFAGMSPRIYESGKTILKKSAISKMGSAKLRQMCYLCALSASRTNPSCKALYTRLLQKGRPKKVALIAVGAKLLRQAFGVLKHQIAFDPQFKQKMI